MLNYHVFSDNQHKSKTTVKEADENEDTIVNTGTELLEIDLCNSGTLLKYSKILIGDKATNLIKDLGFKT